MIRLACLLRGHRDYPARIGRDRAWRCDRCRRLEVPPATPLVSGELPRTMGS